jgi:hypothetical protein
MTSVVAIAVSAINAVAPPISAAGRENDELPTRIGDSPKPDDLAVLVVWVVSDMQFPPNDFLMTGIQRDGSPAAPFEMRADVTPLTFRAMPMAHA